MAYPGHRWRGIRRIVAGIASVAILTTGLVAGSTIGADAFEIPTGTWVAASTTTGTVAMPSGVTVTVTGTGATRIDPTATLGSRGWDQTQYSPTMVTGDSVTTPRVYTRTCAAIGFCSGLGTLTVAFSQPVRNPVLHLAGIGGWIRQGDAQSDQHAVLDLATTGLSLTKVAGNTQLSVSGTRITATNDSTSASCTTPVNATPATPTATPAAGTAACGSVQVNGTVTSVVFNVSAMFVQNPSATGSYNDGSSGSTTGDAFGLTVTLSQDFGDAPTSYNATQAPAHIIGDARLGATLPDADHANVRNSTTSPFASASADGDDLNTTDDENAFTALPTLVSGFANTYALSVPISGISKTAYVCGYIDLNKSTTFDTTTERACATVSAGATTASLSWAAPATTTAGTSYARFRIGYTQAQVQSPTGLADSGEVEDYVIVFAGRPTITVNKVTETVAGGPFGFTLTNTTQTTGSVTTTAVATATQVDGDSSTTGVQPFTAAAVNTAVTINESSSPAGWVLSSATCTTAGGVTVGNLSGTTYTLPASAMTPGAAITCTFTNGQPSVTVSKVWVVGGQTYANGAQPAGLAAQLSLTGPGTSGSTAQAWGTPRAGYSLGSTTTVSETTTLSGDYALCTVTAVVTQINGAASTTPLPATGYVLTVNQRATTAQITNTVVCTQSLSLVKRVTYGSEAESTWKLTATGPAGALTGPSGNYSSTTPVTADVSANQPYVLTESGGPATYVQVGLWTCVDQVGAAVTVDAGNTVSLKLGQRAECTVSNSTASLVILATVLEPAGDLTPASWTITATPAALAGLTPVSRVGADYDAAGNTASTLDVRPGHTYTLTEAQSTASTDPYRFVRLERLTGVVGGTPQWTTVTDPVITAPAAGESATYRYVYAAIPALVLPLTGGLGADAFTLGGIAVILAALFVGLIHHRRTRRSAV